MNRFKKTVATLLAATMCVSMLTACTKANCKAESDISFVTSDKLYPLSFGVGNEVTMNLRYKVTSAEASVTLMRIINFLVQNLIVRGYLISQEFLSIAN